jgi:hypothetical protein
MAKWIGASVYGSATINIAVASREGFDALARYIDILRREYRDAPDGSDRRRDLARAGAFAQKEAIRLFGRTHDTAGWEDRAAAIYTEAGVVS